MTVTYALPLYPWPPSAEALDNIKTAKSEMNADFLVKPVAAKPGVPVRVLALGEDPPFACDWAKAKDPSDLDSVAGALRWVLEGDANDPRSGNVLTFLRNAFGEDVREVTDDRSGAVAFR